MLTMSFFTDLLGSVMAPKVLTALGGALALILADFLLGVFLSLKQGKFDFRKLPQFLATSVLPYMGSLVLLALFVGVSPVLETIFFTVTAAVAMKYLADIKDKLGGIFTGLVLQSPVAVKTAPVPAQDLLAKPQVQINDVQPRAPNASAQ